MMVMNYLIKCFVAQRVCVRERGRERESKLETKHLGGSSTTAACQHSSSSRGSRERQQREAAARCAHVICMYELILVYIELDNSSNNSISRFR